MRRSLVGLFFVALICGSAEAQVISKGGVSGTIQTYRALVGVAPAPPVVMFTTPTKKGVFIVTQACATNKGGFIFDNGNPALQIISSATGTAFNTNSRCVTYSPGLALPAGAAVTCNNGDTGDTNACLVTGVLSKH